MQPAASLLETTSPLVLTGVWCYQSLSCCGCSVAGRLLNNTEKGLPFRATPLPQSAKSLFSCFVCRTASPKLVDVGLSSLRSVPPPSPPKPAALGWSCVCDLLCLVAVLRMPVTPSPMCKPTSTLMRTTTTECHPRWVQHHHHHNHHNHHPQHYHH